ncbi:DUF3318 domain-containing protein [Ralstonia syzygii]|uniref:DUF3318 domain-containing protein n=1 Tax=Ralstonia syzygii TaxID=28097 RepID=UPI0018D02B41|nr:DUF3318 domain-containing protein [Ralstonia syzygii]CAH0446767.1 hypothetical protein LMG10661_02831 [Ralstonia syzygii subsp. syzygii]
MTEPNRPGDVPDHEAAHTARHHVRPSRRGGEARLPLAVRKELLLTLAALERYDYAQARNDVRRATGRTFSLGGLGALLPSLVRPLARPNSLMRALGIAREYPLLGAVLSLTYAGLRRTVIGRVTRRLGKLGLAAGAAWWGYRKWQETQADRAAEPMAAAGSSAPEPSADIIPGSTS